MQLLTLLEAPGARRMQYAELLPALLECTPATAPWAAERAVVVSLFERDAFVPSNFHSAKTCSDCWRF